MDSMRNDLVYKSNELIMGHYALSAAAQKVAASLIGRVNPDHDTLPEFQMSVAEYAQMLNISRQTAYESLDNITTELKQLVIRLQGREEESFEKISLFSRCRYDHRDKVVAFTFEPLMEPHIRDFKRNFTKYQLEQIRQLKSRYSIRLYEILRKSHPLASQVSCSFLTLPLSDLKAALGVKEDAYQGRFDRFKQYVLKTASRELSEKTDLAFEFECIRKGRKVGAIKFIIRHNERFEALPDNEALEAEILPDTVDENLVAMIRMQLPDISDQELQILATGYSRELLMEALLNLAGATARQEIQTTPMQYFQGILKHKRQEDPAPARKPQTTAEKLNDRDWAEGLDLEMSDEIR